MAENIIGPFGPGVNETTTRPADQRPGSAIDTWFAPCINGDPSTGTRVTATWLNKVTALLRRAIRGMNVPDDALDDDMLLKAIQRADVPLASVGGAIPVFDGLADGKYNIRSLEAGTDITITVVDGGPGVGKKLVISSTAAGGGGSVNEPILVLKGDGSSTPVVYSTNQVITSLAVDFRSSDGPTWDPGSGAITVPVAGIYRVYGSLHCDDYQASSDLNILEVGVFVNDVLKVLFAPHGVGWGQPGGCTIAWDCFVQCAANDVIKIKSMSQWIRHFREANYSQVIVQRVRDLV